MKSISKITLAMCMMIVSLATNAAVGEAWKEVLFKAGETQVSVPVTFDTEGLTLSTVGRPFMDSMLDVAYNTDGNNELDWNSGTKLVIAAKDKITGIVMEGDELIWVTAEAGTWNNGEWSGEVAAGDTLTLTSNDAIKVKKITVLYNGASMTDEEGEDDKPGSIHISYPVANQEIASISNGGLLAKFTISKKYTMIHVHLKNTNDMYANLYDLPIRYMTNYDGFEPGEYTCNTQVPDMRSFSLFNGDSYELVVKGFVNPWDNSYDAVATIPVMGAGREHEKLSDVKMVSIKPSHDGELYIKGGTITLTFDGPVSSVTAVNARGLEGSTVYNGTPKEGTDNTVWEVKPGDLSGISSAETEAPVFGLMITAKDANGATVAFSNQNSQFGLQIQYVLTNKEPEPEEEEEGAPEPELAWAN